MYKTYKFRICPNDLQKILLNEIFGCGRLVYNHYLSVINKNKYMNAKVCIANYVDNFKVFFSCVNLFLHNLMIHRN